MSNHEFNTDEIKVIHDSHYERTAKIVSGQLAKNELRIYKALNP